MNGTKLVKLACVFWLTLWCATLASKAQLIPPDPFYQLNYWQFQAPDYLSDAGDGPLGFTNINNPVSFDGNALQVDAPSNEVAFINYPIKDSISTNVMFFECTIEVWTLPDWNSGAGPGGWGRIIDIGQFSTNSPSSWFSLYFSPDGSTINFSSVTNGIFTNYLRCPIAWDTNTYHLLDLTWNRDVSKLYIDGQLATNGPGVFYEPSEAAETNGFFIGSAAGGIPATQARAQFDDLATYSYALSAEEITNDYALGLQAMSGGGFGYGDGLPPFLPGGGGGTNTPDTYSNLPPINYGTNLWIAQVHISSNYLYAIGTNTIADVPYQIRSWTNLSKPTNWVSQGFVTGAEITNWTPLIPLALSRTNNFFIDLLSWGSSDGSGLPSWWEAEYFGTNAIDPNAYDSAGDGYTIYQKFLLGVPPNVWATPQAPQGLMLNYNGNTGAVILSWLPSPGAVTNYQIQKVDSDTGVTTISNVSPTSYSYFDNVSGDTPYFAVFDGPTLFVDYTVTAQYALGNSAPATVSLEPTYLVAFLVVAPHGAAYAALPTLPAGTASLLLTRVDQWNEIFGYDPSDFTNYSIALSTGTNGLYPIPTNAMTAPADSDGVANYIWYIQTVNASNAPTSEASFLSEGYYPQWIISRLVPPYIDGRAALKDNVRFLLQDSSGDEPFTVQQGDYMQFSAANYVCASFYNCSFYHHVSGYLEDAFDDYPTYDPLMGLENNCLFRNLMFTPSDIDPITGAPDTGADQAYGYPYDYLSVTNTPAYEFDITNEINLDNDTVFTSLIASGDATGILPVEGGGFGGNVGSGFVVSAQTNFYGLPLVANEVSYIQTNGDLLWGNYYVGQAVPFSDYSASYLEYTPPVFQTTNYYFVFPGKSPMPEQNILTSWYDPGITNFATTNETPLLITSIGNPVQVAGYAKLAVLNGYANRFAYLGQYFDRAYQIDTNGNVTTNTTGVLSEYGDFFATQPGPVALITMPDIDTGARGTCMVYAVSLQLDKNHDGIMDKSFDGPDTTSQANPMLFWINNDCDWWGHTGDPGHDIDQPMLPDYQSVVIRSQRDLEDFARLWVCGLPSFPASQGYSFQFSMNAVSLNPAIVLAQCAETNGGTGYLTDTNVAAEYDFHINPNAPGLIGMISPTNTLTLPTSMFTNGGNQYFMFEGAGVGEGQLVFSVLQNGQTIVQASAWLDLHNIRDMYERAVITNNQSGSISNWTSGIESVTQATVSDPNEDTNLIVYVHGGDNTDFAWLARSDTITKRLYWAGYHGKIATVRWPSPTEINLANLGLQWFNFSELISYKSASSLKAYINQLYDRLPGYQLNLLPQSLGGCPVSEALREGAPFTSLILCQSAVAASCYNIDSPTNTALFADNSGSGITPWLQPMGYYGVYTNLNGRIISYFNTNDSFMNLWIFNQGHFKPPNSTYVYDGTNAWNYSLAFFPYLVTDPQESRAMVSRALTWPIGGQGPVSGQTSQGVVQSAVNLQTQFGIGSSGEEHSAFFTRPIQSILPLYHQFLSDFNIPSSGLQ